MFKFRNIDRFIPHHFEKVGMLKGKRWYIDTKTFQRGLFKPQRQEPGNKDVFCGNHYGEVIGSALATNAGIPTCKAELAHLSKYYPDIHKERYYGTPIEKDGGIIYSQLNQNDILEAGKVTIERFEENNQDRYREFIKDERRKQDVNNNIELVLSAVAFRVEDFYRTTGNYSEEFIQSKIEQTRKRIIEMVVYDCLYGNYDRHDENWSMHIKANQDIDLYPLYDNEKVLGLYENQDFIEKALRSENMENIAEETFFSIMHVPGETKEHSTYKDMLTYLMRTYPHETEEILTKQLSKNTDEHIKKYLEDCEGLPSVYINFGTQMYAYRRNFARDLLEHKKNQESLVRDEGR